MNRRILAYREGVQKMMEIEAITARKELLKGKIARMCPDCGGSMNEVDRVNEDGFTYIWYECAEVGCDGQWLERKAINLL
jgi:hypothetical protein